MGVNDGLVVGGSEKKEVELGILLGICATKVGAIDGVDDG